MKNVGIICGGFSSEFDISVKSAQNIQGNFPDEYNSYLILLQKEGWFVQLKGERVPLDSRTFSFQIGNETISIDLAIVYIHGDPGENGKVQAYLEMIDVPYVNSGPLASQLSFDKWYCNQFLSGFNIPVAKSMYLTDKTNSLDSKKVVAELGLPVFVKPCDSGSSYGIAKVNEEKHIQRAIDEAFEEGRTVVLEAFLDGVEVTCGVYRTTEGIKPLPLTEIVSKTDFFDYEAKYKGLSDEITPARISDKLTNKVQALTIEIYKLLNLRSIARVDYMIVNSEPVVIEVNTTPGFTDESLVPQMIEAANLSIKEFWSEILDGELA